MFSFPLNLRSRYGREGGTRGLYMEEKGSGLATDEKVEPRGLVTEEKVEPWGLVWFRR